MEVVIDETLAYDPVNYTMSTFIQNLNVEDRSCFSFLTNTSLWRYDKRIQSSSLGKSQHPSTLALYDFLVKYA